MTALDELRRMREFWTAEDERLRRELGATAVDIRVTVPVSDVDRLILELEERDQAVARCQQQIAETQRRARRLIRASLALVVVMLFELLSHLVQ